MTSIEKRTTFLLRHAPQYAAQWRALGAQTFSGALCIATENSVYRFLDGVSVSRARKTAGPSPMRGVRLIGFFSDSGFSQTWSSDACAVLWNGSLDENAFIFTSPIVELGLGESEPTAAPPVSGIRRMVPPPSFHRPLPASMTRLHTAPAVQIPR